MKTIELKETDYTSLLTERDTEIAVSQLKTYFSQALSKKLNLIKVEAPLLVVKGTGINDDLNMIHHNIFQNLYKQFFLNL